MFKMAFFKLGLSIAKGMAKYLKWLSHLLNTVFHLSLSEIQIELYAPLKSSLKKTLASWIL